MGNGQNRNRRGGARTRHGPHRGGAGNNDRRSDTRLVPPVTAASVGDDAEALDQSEEREESEESQAVMSAGEPADDHDAEPTMPASDAEPAEPAEGETPTPEEVDQPAGVSAETTLALEAASALPEAPEAQEEATEAPEMERRAPRGRFERFYAPGQGPRADQNGNGAASTNGVGHHHRPVREPQPAQPAQPAQSEEEVEALPSGPREDVRGAVGPLIDSLRDLFTKDRTVASQGGSSRCGICYFHFPVAELVYREAEGFYVCQNCERALGVARVSMVRRQQRV